MKIKKIMALLLACLMILSLAACGTKEPITNPDENLSNNETEINIPKLEPSSKDVSFTTFDGADIISISISSK